MQIDKIKWSGDTVYIEWSEAMPAGPNKYALDAVQRALPEFYQKFGSLVDHVVEILELPLSYATGIEARGVHFNYKKDVMGVVITIVKRLPGSKKIFVINTPHCPETPYGPGKEFAGCLSTECAQVLKELQLEAELYIQGKRAQLELPLDGEPPGKKKNIHKLNRASNN